MKEKKKERLISLHLAGVCPLSEHVQVVGSWGERGTTDSGGLQGHRTYWGEVTFHGGGGGGGGA